MFAVFLWSLATCHKVGPGGIPPSSILQLRTGTTTGTTTGSASLAERAPFERCPGAGAGAESADGGSTSTTDELGFRFGRNPTTALTSTGSYGLAPGSTWTCTLNKKCAMVAERSPPPTTGTGGPEDTPDMIHPDPFPNPAPAPASLSEMTAAEKAHAYEGMTAMEVAMLTLRTPGPNCNGNYSMNPRREKPPTGKVLPKTCGGDQSQPCVDLTLDCGGTQCGCVEACQYYNDVPPDNSAGAGVQCADAEEDRCAYAVVDPDGWCHFYTTSGCADGGTTTGAADFVMYQKTG